MRESLAPLQFDSNTSDLADIPKAVNCISIGIPNGSSARVQAVDEVSDALFELEIKADLPAKTQLLSLRLFMSNGYCDSLTTVSMATGRAITLF